MRCRTQRFCLRAVQFKPAALLGLAGQGKVPPRLTLEYEAGDTTSHRAWGPGWKDRGCPSVKQALVFPSHHTCLGQSAPSCTCQAGLESTRPHFVPLGPPAWHRACVLGACWWKEGGTGGAVAVSTLQAWIHVEGSHFLLHWGQGKHLSWACTGLQVHPDPLSLEKGACGPATDLTSEVTEEHACALALVLGVWSHSQGGALLRVPCSLPCGGRERLGGL